VINVFHRIHKTTTRRWGKG